MKFTFIIPKRALLTPLLQAVTVVSPPQRDLPWATQWSPVTIRGWEEARKSSFLWILKAAWPRQHLDLRLLCFPNHRPITHVCCSKPPNLMAFLHGSPRKRIQCVLPSDLLFILFILSPVGCEIHKGQDLYPSCPLLPP